MAGRTRISYRRKRRITSFRVRKAEWVDPYPQIPGTRPEKMIFDALVRRGIYFIYQGELADVGVTEKQMPLLQVVGFQPDIICPEYRLIYDPFGDFHHSEERPVGGRYVFRNGKLVWTGGGFDSEHLGRDALKSVLYTSLGFEFIHPWSTDVEKNGGDWAVNLSQRIHQPPRYKLTPAQAAAARSPGYTLGKNLGVGSRAVALANAKRRHTKAPLLRR